MDSGIKFLLTLLAGLVIYAAVAATLYVGLPAFSRCLMTDPYAAPSDVDQPASEDHAADA